MTNGKLGMIVCPILEDEMIYNLKNDSEEKNIFMLMNDFNSTTVAKLKKNDLPFTEIGEAEFLEGKVKIPDDGYNVIIWDMSLGLHQEPEILKEKIHDELKRIDGLVDGLILYYGLCGQALLGICEWAEQNLRTPLTIFKDRQGKICDDCIAVPLGGSEAYLKLLRKYPGIMYLTPAMAGNQDEFMDKMEIFKGLGDDGPKDYDMLKMILDMAGYKYAMKIQTGLGDQDTFQQSCEEYVKKLDLELIELEDGWTSTEVADRTYEEAKGFLN